MLSLMLILIVLVFGDYSIVKTAVYFLMKSLINIRCAHMPHVMVGTLCYKLQLWVRILLILVIVGVFLWKASVQLNNSASQCKTRNSPEC